MRTAGKDRSAILQRAILNEQKKKKSLPLSSSETGETVKSGLFGGRMRGHWGKQRNRETKLTARVHFGSNKRNTLGDYKEKPSQKKKIQGGGVNSRKHAQNGSSDPDGGYETIYSKKLQLHQSRGGGSGSGTDRAQTTERGEGGGVNSQGTAPCHEQRGSGAERERNTDALQAGQEEKLQYSKPRGRGLGEGKVLGILMRRAGEGKDRR